VEFDVEFYDVFRAGLLVAVLGPALDTDAPETENFMITG